jgi:oligopeptide/dipeptide ABC transporter ATP-binding protein
MSDDAVGTNRYLLKVENLRTYFPIRKGLLRRTEGYVKAVDGVSFGIKAGQTLGLVGESGCGKTTLARSIVRLVSVTEGRVVFDGRDVLSAGRDELRRLRGEIGLVFQDSYGSLDPIMTVGDIVGEPLKVQGVIRRCEVGERVMDLLSKVGLSVEHVNRYPHEFSGGQRQRIGVARALALGPKLVICDEPVSSLDVSIQAQTLNLLKDLQEEFGLTFLFIAHDLAVVEFFCDVVAVMLMGRIVEQASAEELYRNPLHPYTRALISAVPRAEPGVQRPRKLFGAEPLDGSKAVSRRDAQGVLNCLSGCAFYPECSERQEKCLRRMPELDEKEGYRGHYVACWKS